MTEHYSKCQHCGALIASTTGHRKYHGNQREKNSCANKAWIKQRLEVYTKAKEEKSKKEEVKKNPRMKRNHLSSSACQSGYFHH